jgi:tetratricopeptide (TPR) repeat protein
VPDTEDALRQEIARLEAAMTKAADEQERGRIKTAIGNLQLRLERVTRPPTAMKEKPEGAPPKKPLLKESAEDRALKLKKESKDLVEKIKMSQDPADKKQLEQRIRDIEQELKTLDLARPQVNIKDVEMRLQSDPDDVAALVDRGTWHVDNGRAEPAMKDLNRAIALKPDCAPAYLKRAIAHALMGKQSEAWADAKRGEQLDLKAGKMIDDTTRALKKLLGNKERRIAPGDVENQIATLKERLEELKAMSSSADLPEADRERAARDAARVQVEIERLTTDLKSRPAEPEKKPVQKK